MNFDQLTFSRRAALGLAATAALALAGCQDTAAADADGDKTNGSDAVADSSSSSADAGVKTFVDADDPYGTGIHHATIEIADYGTLELALNANVAPITVSNFCHLAADGFYDGLTFHRIISGFMIQGGDPEGNGTGGSDQKIKGEFSQNGVENNIPHVRGTVSMARSSAADSASSQFFIVHETSSNNTSSLDGKYAAFGNVTSGMDVVDKICEDVTPTDSNGTVAAADQPVITKITVVD